MTKAGYHSCQRCGEVFYGGTGWYRKRICEPCRATPEPHQTKMKAAREARARNRLCVTCHKTSPEYFLRHRGRTVCAPCRVVPDEKSLRERQSVIRVRDRERATNAYTKKLLASDAEKQAATAYAAAAARGVGYGAGNAVGEQEPEPEPGPAPSPVPVRTLPKPPAPVAPPKPRKAPPAAPAPLIGRSCRWIEGEDYIARIRRGESPYNCPDAPLLGKPYCAVHYERAHVPQWKRKPRRGPMRGGLTSLAVEPLG